MDRQTHRQEQSKGPRPVKLQRWINITGVAGGFPHKLLSYASSLKVLHIDSMMPTVGWRWGWGVSETP